MKNKEKTMIRKNERKLKKNMEGIFDLDALKQEIHTKYPQKYPDEIVEPDRIIRQPSINLQCQFEVTQIFNQGYQQ